MLRRLVLGVAVCILSGCAVAAGGSGTSGDVAWAFTINNTMPASAALPGGGGLVVVVSYVDGGSASYVVAAGGSMNLPGNGATAVVSGGGSSVVVGPGQAVFWTSSGLSSSPPQPMVAN